MKVTKAMIKKDLKTLKQKQESQIRKEINEKIRALKLSKLDKYNDLIGEINEIATNLCQKTDKLRKEIKNNEELTSYIAEISSEGRLFGALKEKDSFKEYLRNNIDFSKSKIQVNIRDMNNELNSISDEWNKLIIQIDNLSLKQAKEFLIENKIELDCMKEKEVTTLVVQDINLNKLCFKEEVKNG